MPYKHLNDHERYVICHLNSFGLPKAEIARRLKRSASTISREIKRNANSMGQYLYDYAERCKPLTPGPPTHGHAESNFLSAFHYIRLRHNRGQPLK